MKVGYVAPASIAAVNGGVRIQALNTIKQIKKLNIETVLLSPWDKIEDQQLDLVHVFGATVENVGIINSLNSMQIPVVISPVFYANQGASFIKNALRIEKLTTIIGSGIKSDYGVKALICRQSDLILPNTTEEALLIENGFSVLKNKIHVVPNGVEDRFSQATPDLFFSKYGFKDIVLFVGQAGAPRKNVVKLLKIASQINEPVVIIGSFYDDEYGKRCRDLAGQNTNVYLFETMNHDSDLLASAYAASKAFVLPSLYETPGIAALEAGLAGANIVITQNGGTKDYFNNYAEYIDPNSTKSLLKGIKTALVKKKTDLLKNHISKYFTWEIVASQTADHYKALVS